MTLQPVEIITQKGGCVPCGRFDQRKQRGGTINALPRRGRGTQLRPAIKQRGGVYVPQAGMGIKENILNALQRTIGPTMYRITPTLNRGVQQGKELLTSEEAVKFYKSMLKKGAEYAIKSILQKGQGQKLIKAPPKNGKGGRRPPKRK